MTEAQVAGGDRFRGRLLKCPVQKQIWQGGKRSLFSSQPCHSSEQSHAEPNVAEWQM